jgi:hypothetical protein
VADHHLSDVTFWKSRAEKARAAAETYRNSATKKTMLDMAKNYEDIARNAEKVRAEEEAYIARRAKSPLAAQ